MSLAAVEEARETVRVLTLALEDVWDEGKERRGHVFMIDHVEPSD